MNDLSWQPIQDPITEREREILRLIAEGFSNQEIATHLFIAPGTVKVHTRNIYSKLQVSSRTQAILQARRSGLLETASDESQPLIPINNLPPQLTPFIGRAGELTALAERLTDPACRLLTLVGPGGSGKTRLAIQIAAQRLNDFADGVWFVPLAPLGSPDSIVPAMVSAMGLYFDASDTPEQQLLGYLRRKHLLLIMDNFEHLLDGATLLTDILYAAPGVRILATSREALNLQEECVQRVEGLRFPASSQVENIQDYSAVRLLAERARRVCADFSAVDNLEDVTRICQLVQGMPLGIELAAAWLKSLSCAQIAGEIQRSLDFLASPLRNVPERHRSMRVVFDHSWKLLSAKEQVVFRKLAVFRGGFEREAAERVAHASLHSLATLVDKSLLQCTPAGRYGVHELLRQYAEEQLEVAGESADVRAAHSAYFMDFLARRDTDLKGRRQKAALYEIRTDFENIRRAWGWAQDHCHYDAISGAINCFVSYADMSSGLSDVLGIVRQTADAFEPASGHPPHPVRDKVVVRREWLKFHARSQVDHTLINAILRRMRERNDLEEVAWCLWVLRDHASLGDDPVSHLAIAEEALALRRVLKDEFYIARALIGVENAYTQCGQLEQGLECLFESVAIRRRLGEKHGLSFSLFWVAIQLMNSGRFAEADNYLDQAISVQDEIGKTPVYVPLMTFKATLAFWRGEVETAAQFVQAGLDFARDQDYLGTTSLALAISSFVKSIEGGYERARHICEQVGTSQWQGLHEYYFGWGRSLACCGLGDDSEAERSLYSILRHAVYNLRAPALQRLCLPLAAILAARRGDLRYAVELLGLTYSAPLDLTGWLGKWPLMIRLRADLEAELGSEVYVAAWERGKGLDVETIIAELLGNA